VKFCVKLAFYDTPEIYAYTSIFYDHKGSSDISSGNFHTFGFMVLDCPGFWA